MNKDNSEIIKDIVDEVKTKKEELGINSYKNIIREARKGGINVTEDSCKVYFAFIDNNIFQTIDLPKLLDMHFPGVSISPMRQIKSKIFTVIGTLLSIDEFMKNVDSLLYCLYKEDLQFCRVMKVQKPEIEIEINLEYFLEYDDKKILLNAERWLWKSNSYKFPEGLKFVGVEKL